jgi:uncharacterized protein (DUF305 family)
MDKKLIITAVVALVAGLGIGVGAKSFYQKPRDTQPKPMTSVQMDHSMSMQGTMDSMNQGLQGKTGDEFDKAFLTEMAVHHQGAIEMSKLVLEKSKRPELLQLAGEIITAQEHEIKLMQNWEQHWFASSTLSK